MGAGLYQSGGGLASIAAADISTVSRIGPEQGL